MIKFELWHNRWNDEIIPIEHLRHTYFKNKDLSVKVTPYLRFIEGMAAVNIVTVRKDGSYTFVVQDRARLLK